MDVSKYKNVFLSEAKENLQLLNESLLKLEKNPADLKPVGEMFRAAHSLKGMAATMNYDKLAGLCHAIEDVLDKVRKKEADLTSDMVEVFFECFDNLELSLRRISGGEDEADASGSLSKLNRLLSAPGEKLVSEVPMGVGLAEKPSSIEKIREIKVNVETLDTLAGLVEELLVNKMLLDQLYASEKFGDMPGALDALGRLVSDLQFNIMQARLVPVGQIFRRFPRMVRDLARREQKQVSLVLEGAEIELDRKIVDKLGEPLVHLLRNAVDHGVEVPSERERLGKPAVGTIRLVARREKDYAIVEVEDDGRGVSEEKVKRVAVEKKILSGKEAAGLGYEETVALLFDSRFSAAEMVTEVSGRGVGLDVVKRTVESLGGTVQVVTQSGKGMKVTLKFPLTLAIISALLTKVGGEIYAVPLTSVVRSVRVKTKDVRRMLGREVVVFPEGNVPLLRLCDFFSFPHEREEGALMVLVNRGDEFLGLGVDGLLDKQDIIVKPLDRLVRQSRVFAGFTILGDGKPALILDVNSLFDSLVEEQKYSVNVS
ncbi:MAG: chemotaxis protein CheA [Candidatus Bathyarchaeota archaeon]|nr:chemotaxis protein CheA [Candidatus Bathyarchaeota archaeon]